MNIVAGTLQASDGGMGTPDRCGELVPALARSVTTREGQRMGCDQDTFIVGPLAAHSSEHGHAMTTQQAAECGQLITHTISAEGHDASEDGTFAGNQMAVRRLTPRECERLQGFPDDWTRYADDGKEISDSARYRMLGNAVAVPVAEWISKRIIDSFA